MRLRVAPFFDIALEESPDREQSADLRSETAGRRSAVRESAATISSAEPPSSRRVLRGAATETIRTRFFGTQGRNIATPVFVETGTSDGSQSDDGRRVAAFAGEITLAPGGEAKIAIVFGQAPTSRGRPRRRRCEPKSSRPRRKSRRRARAGASAWAWWK